MCDAACVRRRLSSSLLPYRRPSTEILDWLEEPERVDFQKQTYQYRRRRVKNTHLAQTMKATNHTQGSSGVRQMDGKRFLGAVSFWTRKRGVPQLSAFGPSLPVRCHS